MYHLIWYCKCCRWDNWTSQSSSHHVIQWIGDSSRERSFQKSCRTFYWECRVAWLSCPSPTCFGMATECDEWCSGRRPLLWIHLLWSVIWTLSEGHCYLYNEPVLYGQIVLQSTTARVYHKWLITCVRFCYFNLGLERPRSKAVDNGGYKGLNLIWGSMMHPGIASQEYFVIYKMSN